MTPLGCNVVQSGTPLSGADRVIEFEDPLVSFVLPSEVEFFDLRMGGLAALDDATSVEAPAEL
jgi:hypothetical protein